MLKQIVKFALIGALFIQASYADEIQESIKDAEKAYSEGMYSKSIESLEQAMNLIKDVQAAKIIQYFPKPLEGWQVADGKDGAASPIPNVQLGMFSSVIRRYTEKPTSGISVNLLASDDAKANKTKKKTPWVQFTLLQKPNGLIKMGYQGMHALRASNPAAQKLQVDGYEGVLLCDAKKPVCDVFFDFDGNFMLMINAEHTEEKILKDYAQAFDVDGLIKAN